MRILLANNHLAQYGGSERWTETMYRTLSREHDVDVFTFTDNVVFEAPRFDPAKQYDLGLINHNTCLRHLAGAKIKARIFTSHGVLPPLEHAIPGADEYVGVSEETADAIPFQATVIRNPIDVAAFSPTRQVNDTLQNILFLSNNQGQALDVIRRAATGYNLEVIGRQRQVKNVVDWINAADLVIGLGRSAYEAMACNRNVVIYDKRGGWTSFSQQYISI